MDSNAIACNNCQAVTTNDGKTVWVCENCGQENTPAQTQAPVTQPVTPDEPVVSAQPVAAQPTPQVVPPAQPQTAVPPVTPSEPTASVAPVIQEEPAPVVLDPATGLPVNQTV